MFDLIYDEISQGNYIENSQCIKHFSNPQSKQFPQIEISANFPLTDDVIYISTINDIIIIIQNLCNGKNKTKTICSYLKKPKVRLDFFFKIVSSPSAVIKLHRIVIYYYPSYTNVVRNIICSRFHSN